MSPNPWPPQEDRDDDDQAQAWIEAEQDRHFQRLLSRVGFSIYWAGGRGELIRVSGGRDRWLVELGDPGWSDGEYIRLALSVVSAWLHGPALARLVDR